MHLDPLWRIVSPTVVATLLGSFVSYVYEVGLCTRFHVPLWFARPEWMAIYAAALVVFAVSVLLAIPALGWTTSSSGTGHPVPAVFFAVAFRAIVATGIGIFVAGFTTSSGPPSHTNVVMILTGTILFGAFTLPLTLTSLRRWIATTRLGRALIATPLAWIVRPYTGGRPRRSRLGELDVLVRAGWTTIVTSAALVAMVGLAYEAGFRTADEATEFLMLPGSVPQIVLVQYADSYVTAEFDPRTRTVIETFRWHTLSEHARMANVVLGRLGQPRTITCCAELTQSGPSKH